MTIGVFCFDCQRLYSISIDNATTFNKKQTGVTEITTKCPMCGEVSIAGVKNLNPTIEKNKEE